MPPYPLLFVRTHVARSMAEDLEAAGIPKATPADPVDFHALHVAYVCLVIEAGASVKEAQELARHSTPNLTLNVYARAQSQRLQELTERVADAALNGGQRAVCVSNGQTRGNAESQKCRTGVALQEGESWWRIRGNARPYLP